MSSPERIFVFWAPDWPVQAYLAEHPDQLTTPMTPMIAGDSTAHNEPNEPIALIAARRVLACSGTARAQGVRPGMREREALTQCPDLAIHPHSSEVDDRRFAPVLAAIEEVIPGIDPIRPGLCALRGRGPTRYYGSEEAAAAAILEAAAGAGVSDARIGVADGLFTAQQAARAHSSAHGVTAPTANIRIVQAGQSAAFLSSIPIAHAAEEPLAELLRGLGVRTLGAFAALPEDAVRQRFGPAGMAAHRRARAADPAHGTEVRPRPPVRELAAELPFEPPLDTTDQLAFACAQLSEQFVTTLTEERLVCTALHIELVDDLGVRSERLWAHPQHFTAPDVINRIRWQADAVPPGSERGGAGIALVRLTPARTEHVHSHEPTLWSSEPDARVHHRFSQVQSRLGHTGVGTIVLGGGRLVRERQSFVPWGNQPESSALSGPWPGALPAPRPSRVFQVPPPVELLDTAGTPIAVDLDDMLSGQPDTAVIGAGAAQIVAAWSPVWAVRERWWEGRPPRFRMQLQLSDGTAWLVLCEHGRWSAEGKYD